MYNNTKIIKEIEEIERCPKCGTGRIIKRYSKKNEEYFYGCSNYPECTWSSPIKSSFIKKNQPVSVTFFENRMLQLLGRMVTSLEQIEHLLEGTE